MWYQSNYLDRAGYTYVVSHAVSADGVRWIRVPGSGGLGIFPPGSTHYPAIVLHEDQVKVWVVALGGIHFTIAALED